MKDLAKASLEADALRKRPGEKDALRKRLEEADAMRKRLKEAWEYMIDFETFYVLKKKHKKPELKQVWFPGTHTNIGGGNPGILLGLPYDYEQFALISLSWMCDQIQN
ncbi:hypothetical protein LZ31DRAFT_601190 [Colletotrichum somersetense]|nr:hypothetical protein LZ31DRAFT_601190 [Colletotrichum somersetense]